MILLEKVVLPSPEQWMAVIRGMRNSMNSWDRSDSNIDELSHVSPETGERYDAFFLGQDDKKLMTNLAYNGAPERKFLRMIPVYVDITAPLYWWKEFDTYKVGTVANSCSTMHKIYAKSFDLDDFSHEHLITPDTAVSDTFIYFVDAEQRLKDMIVSLNVCRENFLFKKEKVWWWQMIQLLPSSYNQRRTVFTNYEVLVNIYKTRSNHKLDEWRQFCTWIDTLPYAELIKAAAKGDLE